MSVIAPAAGDRSMSGRLPNATRHRAMPIMMSFM